MWEQCAALHGFSPALVALLAGETGVAGVVPRRWERKMLLIDAILLNPARSNEMMSICKSWTWLVCCLWFGILPPVDAAAGAGTGMGAGDAGLGDGVGAGTAALTDGL